MSVDDLPYCGDCGMSHRGRHARAEFCQTCNLLMTRDDDGELACTNQTCSRFGQGRTVLVRRTKRHLGN